MSNAISMATFNRLPVYLKALRVLQRQGQEYVSSVALAEEVRENASVVKSDLSYVITCTGKPKLGYEINPVFIR